MGGRVLAARLVLYEVRSAVGLSFFVSNLIEECGESGFRSNSIKLGLVAGTKLERGQANSRVESQTGLDGALLRGGEEFQ